MVFLFSIYLFLLTCSFIYLSILDRDFIAQFIRTHQRFVDSKDFLQKIIERYPCFLRVYVLVVVQCCYCIPWWFKNIIYQLRGIFQKRNLSRRRKLYKWGTPIISNFFVLYLLFNRVINVLKKWIELQLSDFQGDAELVMMLKSFVRSLQKTGSTEAVWASNLQITLVSYRFFLLLLFHFLTVSLFIVTNRRGTSKPFQHYTCSWRTSKTNFTQNFDA